MNSQEPVVVMNNVVRRDLEAWIARQPVMIMMPSPKEHGNQEFKTKNVIVSDFPITDTMRAVMVRELMSLLSYYGFEAVLTDRDSLKVTRRGFTIELDNILAAMPFGDYLPEQVKRAYNAFNYENNIAPDTDYCLYCNKVLNGLELLNNELHNPDKQLCRPCLVYRQLEPMEPADHKLRLANIAAAQEQKTGIYALLKNNNGKIKDAKEFDRMAKEALGLSGQVDTHWQISDE